MYNASKLRRIFRWLAWSLCALWSAVGAQAQQTQLFVQPAIVPTSTWPSAIFNADLRGSGVQDLLYMDYGATPAASTTHVLLNDGKENFKPFGAAIPTAGTSLVATDMIQSDHIDLEWVAVNGQTGTIYRADGNGDGTFQTPVLLTSFPFSGPNPPVVQLAYTNYVTGTGRRTLLIEDKANAELYEAITNSANTISMYPASGQSGITLPEGANEMIAQDINGDGITDVLIQGAYAVEVFLGTSTGFQSPVTYPCTGKVYSMLLYDVNNDGVADLTVEGANGSYNVYMANKPSDSTSGNGTFSTTSGGGTATQNLDATTGFGGYLIGATTVGPTGTRRRHFYTASPAGISVLLGDGTVHYDLKGIYNLGPGRTSFAFADFNGDGYPDVAVDSPLGIVIGYGQADYSIKTSLAFATGQPAYSLALGPFAGTNNIDAAVATGIPQVQLLNGDGAGNFSVETAPQPAGMKETDAARDTWSNLAAGDFDGDGKPDVAITLEGNASSESAASGLSIAFGNGSNSSIATDGSGYGTSAVGDFNADGISDVLNFDGSDAATYLGGVASRTGSMPRNILLTGSSGEPSFNLVATGFLNPGRSVAQDVVVQNGDSFLVYQNNGSGTFTLVNTITPPVSFGEPVNGLLPSSDFYPGSVTLADLDGDGYGDLIISYGNLADIPRNPGSNAATTYIYWGEGNGQFDAPTIVPSQRDLYQSTVANLSPSLEPQLISTDGYLIDVLPFQGRVPNTAQESQYLAGQGINSIAAADVNHDGRLDLVVANGGATLSNPVANKGVLASNPVVDGGGLTVLLNQRTAMSVTGTVQATPNPVLYADNFTLTAIINAPTGDTSATGTVVFSVDGAVVGTATVTNGTATLQVNVPPYSAGTPLVTGYIVGTHTVSAVYSGDANYNSLPMTGNVTVVGQPTVSTFEQLDQSIEYGQEIGYDNGVDALLEVQAQNPAATSAPLDDGTITVTIDGAVVCQTTAGVGYRCPDPPFEGFDAGTYNILELYGGNDYYAPSTSVNYPVVISPDPTTLSLTGSPNPSNLGQSVTFIATVAAPYATPTGSVSLFDGNSSIGTAVVNAQGVATFTIPTLSIGTHSITASYTANLNSNGLVNFLPVTSAPLSHVVVLQPPSPLMTVTLLSSNINPSVVGQSVTFTASVATTGAFITLPAGTVQFFDDGSSIGNATLDAQGNAALSTSTLAAGQHTITAVYAGDTITATSTSTALLQQVNTPVQSAGNGFLLSISPANITVGVGNSAVLTVTITDLNQFDSPVQLSCTGLPSEATCAFGTTTIAAGGGSTTLVVTAAAPHNCGVSTPYFISSSGESGWLGLVAAALALLLFVDRRRRLLRGLLLVVLLGVISVASGCGNCTDLGTKPAKYSFTVTATAAGTTAMTKSQVIPMNVTI